MGSISLLSDVNFLWFIFMFVSICNFTFLNFKIILKKKKEMLIIQEIFAQLTEVTDNTQSYRKFKGKKHLVLNLFFVIGKFMFYCENVKLYIAFSNYW